MAAANAGTPVIGRRKRHQRRVMSEINVTPMVDVMLVLLIIFMVSAPLLTVGVPIDLPQSQAKSLDQDKEPLTVSVNEKGQVFLQNAEIKAEDMVTKLKAVAEARGLDHQRAVRVHLLQQQLRCTSLATLSSCVARCATAIGLTYSTCTPTPDSLAGGWASIEPGPNFSAMDWRHMMPNTRSISGPENSDCCRASIGDNSNMFRSRWLFT